MTIKTEAFEREFEQSFSEVYHKKGSGPGIVAPFFYIQTHFVSSSRLKWRPIYYFFSLLMIRSFRFIGFYLWIG